MSVGPVGILIKTALPLGEALGAVRDRGETPLFALSGVGPHTPHAARVVHVETLDGAGALWDGATLTVRADTGMLSAETLLHLAYLVMESELQRQGYMTLHAAAACRDGATVVLLGPAGAGKTTTLLRLCRDHGAALAGNDLVIVGGSPAAPEVLAGSRYLRLRHASLAQVMPELLQLFPARVGDSWRAKLNVDPAVLKVETARLPTPVAAVVFVHVDLSYPRLVEEPGDTLVHRLNLHENAVRYIRGTSTPWLLRDGQFGSYLPPLDDERAHSARAATLESLFARSRYVAGPPASVAQHLSTLFAKRAQVPVAAEGRTP